MQQQQHHRYRNQPAQLLGASMLTGTALTLYYFPVLILSGVGMGLVTGLVLKTVLPAVEKLDRQLR